MSNSMEQSAPSGNFWAKGHPARNDTQVKRLFVQEAAYVVPMFRSLRNEGVKSYLIKRTLSSLSWDSSMLLLRASKRLLDGSPSICGCILSHPIEHTWITLNFPNNFGGVGISDFEMRENDFVDVCRERTKVFCCIVRSLESCIRSTFCWGSELQYLFGCNLLHQLAFPAVSVVMSSYEKLINLSVIAEGKLHSDQKCEGQALFQRQWNYKINSTLPVACRKTGSLLLVGRATCFLQKFSLSLFTAVFLAAFLVANQVILLPRLLSELVVHVQRFHVVSSLSLEILRSASFPHVLSLQLWTSDSSCDEFCSPSGQLNLLVFHVEFEVLSWKTKCLDLLNEFICVIELFCASKCLHYWSIVTNSRMKSKLFHVLNQADGWIRIICLAANYRWC